MVCFFVANILEMAPIRLKLEPFLRFRILRSSLLYYVFLLIPGLDSVVLRFKFPKTDFTSFFRFPAAAYSFFGGLKIHFVFVSFAFLISAVITLNEIYPGCGFYWLN